MSDEELIRRGDALAIVARDRVPTNRTGSEFRVVSTQDMLKAIAALPAVTVGVPEATVYRAVLDWIRDDAGAAIKMTITPDQANALTGRILAALEPVEATLAEEEQK